MKPWTWGGETTKVFIQCLLQNSVEKKEIMKVNSYMFWKATLKYHGVFWVDLKTK